jgi:hypothetical protein
MGYESRLYVINKSTLAEDINGKKMYWAEVVATFNLCVAGTVIEMCEYPETDAYFCDGNILVTEDKYGEPLKEVPVKDAIEIISKAAKQEHYRRFEPCLNLLKGFDLSEWGGNLAVLHYGY